MSSRISRCRLKATLKSKPSQGGVTIKFFGVREAEAESNPYETERIVKLLLVNELKMPEEYVANIKFERVHRMQLNAQQRHQRIDQDLL